MALLAVAVATTVKTGHAAAAITPIPVKAHGRNACSLFALGLTRRRKLFAKLNQAEVFNALCRLIGAEPPPNPLMRLRR